MACSIPFSVGSSGSSPTISTGSWTDSKPPAPSGTPFDPWLEVDRAEVVIGDVEAVGLAGDAVTDDPAGVVGVGEAQVAGGLVDDRDDDTLIAVFEDLDLWLGVGGLDDGS